MRPWLLSNIASALVKPYNLRCVYCFLCFWNKETGWVVGFGLTQLVSTRLRPAHIRPMTHFDLPKATHLPPLITKCQRTKNHSIWIWALVICDHLGWGSQESRLDWTTSGTAKQATRLWTLKKSTKASSGKKISSHSSKLSSFQRTAPPCNSATSNFQSTSKKSLGK